MPIAILVIPAAFGFIGGCASLALGWGFMWALVHYLMAGYLALLVFIAVMLIRHRLSGPVPRQRSKLEVRFAAQRANASSWR